MTPRRTAWWRGAALLAALLSSAEVSLAGLAWARGGTRARTSAVTGTAVGGTGTAVTGTGSGASTGIGAPINERFRYSATSQNFEVRSGQRLLLEPLLDVAESTLWRTRAWLGSTGPASYGPTLIFLTDDDEGLHAVEREYGLASSGVHDGDGAFKGRCFPESHVIVIPYDVGALRWQIAHEVTHIVFDEIVGRNVENVNEGLAELVPYWILSGAPGMPETLDSKYELYDHRLAQAVLERDLPTFDAFLNVDEGVFYDESSQWLWYALSWKFVKVLVESHDPLVQGRLRHFLELLSKGSPVEPALRASYDMRALAAAWQAAVEQPATWRPLFGDWRVDPYGMGGTVSGAHSACVVSSASLFAGESFSMEVTLDGPAPDAAFGFAFDVGSDDQFGYLELRPACGRVTVAEHVFGRWTRVDDYVLDPIARAALYSVQRGQRLTLRAAGHGRLDVLVDGATVFRCDLGRPLRGGSAGLMFENCDTGASERDVLEMHFRGAVLAH